MKRQFFLCLDASLHRIPLPRIFSLQRTLKEGIVQGETVGCKRGFVLTWAWRNTVSSHPAAHRARRHEKHNFVPLRERVGDHHSAVLAARTSWTMFPWTAAGSAAAMALTEKVGRWERGGGRYNRRRRASRASSYFEIDCAGSGPTKTQNDRGREIEGGSVGGRKRKRKDAYTYCRRRQ